jgi:hypothetical protein
MFITQDRCEIQYCISFGIILNVIRITEEVIETYEITYSKHYLM